MLQEIFQTYDPICTCKLEVNKVKFLQRLVPNHRTFKSYCFFLEELDKFHHDQVRRSHIQITLQGDLGFWAIYS